MNSGINEPPPTDWWKVSLSSNYNGHARANINFTCRDYSGT
jgi:hypothetical protein